ncbi:Complement component 1 Q subcomponent-binding protein, mitochondrial [Pseudolycoriella hygida]|uniref:Complement component 1 Q subcomponent-binding protein, mitochondrial n=1 Tax=Pseudolycoriella hygida TaxID=35572 RepID=A0A9Q0MMQ7_9DIPT|nr:Complement component 1 Q subcomponent-binding protein, mitochondrial [Pseudolycoriella hygida]
MMNTIVKSVLRVPTIRSFTAVGRRDFARTFWHMSKPDVVPGASAIPLKKPSQFCSCGCGSHRHKQTKAEQELSAFLNEEIEAEKATQKSFQSLPTQIDGFKVALNGSDIELTKQTDNEKIQISFNINHTVDTDTDDVEQDINANNENAMAEMKSTPNFEVDIVRGGRTVSFTCSFLKGPPEDEYSDLFGIDEVTTFEGEWTEKNYAVAGNLLDGYFYDLLMSLLEEKGVSNDFVAKLSQLSTNYEHSRYIELLEKLKVTFADK